MLGFLQTIPMEHKREKRYIISTLFFFFVSPPVNQEDFVFAAVLPYTHHVPQKRKKRKYMCVYYIYLAQQSEIKVSNANTKN